jgi:hypothetical protein
MTKNQVQKLVDILDDILDVVNPVWKEPYSGDKYLKFCTFKASLNIFEAKAWLQKYLVGEDIVKNL